MLYYNAYTTPTICSDCLAAVQAIQDPRNQSGQRVPQRIINLAGETITYHWCAGHSQIKGDERAHELARKATSVTTGIADGTLYYSTLKRAARKLTIRPRKGATTKTSRSQIAMHIDKGLPRTTHTKQIYDLLSRDETAILCRLRTGKARLNGYLSKMKAVENNLCSCGEPATVRHFMFHCQQWKKQS